MDAYCAGLAPQAFGLNNTGAICYLNSFLQTLAGCTSFTRAVLRNADYLARSKTGAAMLNFVRAFVIAEGAAARPVPEVSLLSSAVLSALVADLAERRPHVRFGAGQESASEALVHILDMMEPADDAPAAVAAASKRKPEERVEGPGSTPTVQSSESVITRLFLHRFQCNLHCLGCKQVVSKVTDCAVNFNLFHFDKMKVRPATVADFSKGICAHISATDDYKCPECHRRKRTEAEARGEDPEKVPVARTKALRVYNLTMAPEIIFCSFNLYVGFGGMRTARYFPDRLEFPSRDNGKLVYRLVGQIEHAGSLAGGHYWARALRADQKVFILNDTGVAPGSFVPTPSTYIVAYHYTGREDSVPVPAVAAGTEFAAGTESAPAAAATGAGPTPATAAAATGQ